MSQKGKEQEDPMPSNDPIFSVSQCTTEQLTFEQDVQLYQRLGVDGIEVCEEKLSEDPAKAREQLAMLKDSSLRITSVQPRMLALFPNIADVGRSPDEPSERLAVYRRTIDLFSECFPGENIPLVVGGGNAPKYNFRLAHQTARRLWPDLADYAADHGLRLMFEPLSPILMNAYTFVTTLDEAVQLIEDVNRANFGLALDVWHVWREPTISERITQLSDRIFGVHICDWPAQEPRTLSDRVLPGEGIIDLPSILGAIDSTGYCEAYCLEIFSDDSLLDSLWRADPSQVIEKGHAGFLNAWRKRHK